MKKITAFILAIALKMTMFTGTIIAEKEGITRDTRYDFISGTDGVINITGNVQSFVAENGEIAVTTNSSNLANKQVHIELPQFDFGDGGYYMYAKISCDLPEGVQFTDSIWGTQTSPGKDYVAAQGGNDWAIWDGTEKVRRFNTTSIKGQQYLRMIYFMGSNSVTGVAKFHVDWIVLSKNPDFADSDDVITSLNDGTNNIILEQDGDMTEVTLKSNVYDSLTEGTDDGLPEGFSAEAADGIGNVLYSTTVTDMYDCKVIDIIATGTKDGVEICKQYRISVTAGEGQAEAVYDTRFDFISGTDGVTNLTGNVESFVAENGEVVLTTNSSNLANKQLHIELPQIDFGNGGYYVYAKIRCELPEGAEFSDSVWGTQTSPGKDYVAAQGGNDWTAWDGTEKIRRFNTTSIKGQQYLRMIYFMGSSSVNGVAKFHIDWIVLSKNANLGDEVIIEVNDGSNNIILEQNGDMNEIVVTGDEYDLLQEGVSDSLPEGFTAELAAGIEDAVYSTTVTDMKSYKLIDIAVAAKKYGDKINRHYRIAVSVEKDCVELTPDIRFDFISDNEGFTNITTNTASFEAENGEIIVTTKEINLANKQFHIELPQVDFGDGGYYMYAKISCELPEGVKFADSMWGTQTTPGKDAVAAQGGNSWSAWDGTSKIRKLNTAGITGKQYLRMIYMMGSSAVTGVAKFHIDWIVLSKNSAMTAETGVADELMIAGDVYSLPQDGSPLEINLRTGVYNSITDNNKELPEGWEILSSSKIKYEAYVTDGEDYKVADIIVSDSERSRTYRVIAKSGEMGMTTSKGTKVSIPDAINITSDGNNSYKFELYPKQYDLMVGKDIVLDSSDSGEVVKIVRSNGNLSVFVNDVNGDETFRAECKKICSENNVVLESVILNNGKVSYTGRVEDTSAGEAVVAVFDESGDNAVACGTAELDDNGSFSGELSIPQNNSYYDMKVAVYASDAECVKYIKHYDNAVLKDAIDKVKETESAIFTGIKTSEYKELFEAMGIWTTTDVSESRINKLLKEQSEKLTTDNFAYVVNGTIIMAEASGETSAENVTELLSKYDKEMKEIIVSGISFSDIDTKWQNTIVEPLIKKNSYLTWSDFEHAVRERMLFYLIATAEDYKITDELILDNTDVIMYPDKSIKGTAIEKLKNASSSKADSAMKVLVNKQGDKFFSSSSDLISRLEDAFESISSSKNNGGGGSGGGSGGGGSRGNSVQVTVSNSVTSAPDAVVQTCVKYDDLKGYSWAEEAIYYLASKGIVSGVGENRYEPERNITREEFVKLVCEAFDIEKVDYNAEFTDVKSSDWFGGYVSAAVKSGIISGISENEFGTGRFISREDMAVILYRVMHGDEVLSAVSGNSFSDSDEISGYAIEAVGSLSGKGIINGVGDNRFSPKASATRAEAAVIIYRCISIS